MKILNNNGLKKLVTYLEGEHPTLKGRLKIIGERLVLDGDYNLFCLVEEDIPIIQPPRAESDTEMAIGKSSEPTVKAVGRAGIERKKEQNVADIAKKISKQFPTRIEVEKRAKETGAKVDEIEKAIQGVATNLRVK
jgi:hypothetical protein